MKRSFPRLSIAQTRSTDYNQLTVYQFSSFNPLLKRLLHKIKLEKSTKYRTFKNIHQLLSLAECCGETGGKQEKLDFFVGWWKLGIMEYGLIGSDIDDFFV